MKKNFIIILIFLLVAFSSLTAQTSMQASIGSGSAATRAIIYMKALRPTPGAVTETISTLDFNVGVDASAYTTAPMVSVISNVFGITWTVEPALNEGGFWNYHIFKTVDISYSFTTDLETAVMEIELTGGAPTPISSVANLSLVTLTDAGSTGAVVYYCTGTIFSDGSSLYYSRPTDKGFVTTATNGFSYRPTSINSTTGTTPSTATILAAPAPVKFLGFNVIKNKDKALLTWFVENEASITDRYEILRSTNGRDFTAIKTIAALNNGRSANSYSFTQEELSKITKSGIIYFRIKQYDKDGKFALTDIKSVRLNLAGIFAGVYPNPIKQNTTLTFDLVENSRVTYSITDVSGKTMETYQVDGFKGSNIKTLNLGKYAAGPYTLKVQAGDDVITLPIVKASN